MRVSGMVLIKVRVGAGHFARIGRFINPECTPPMIRKIYPGIDKDPKGAMNPTGNIIRDAWVFGLLPETETCEGWTVQRMEVLYSEVWQEWEKYGHLVSGLPADLAERHRTIYGEAVRRAKALGWDPDESLNDD